MQSPQVERDAFESPTSMLPRHSRGLDFSRACTNLHHSTIPDQSSPDSSPKVSHRALKIPSRRQSTVSSMMLDSPRSSGNNPFWSDKTFRPRSLGSTTAMTSEASSSGSDTDEEMKSRYDPDEMLTTPVMHKQSQSIGGVTPYAMRDEIHNPSPISRRFAPHRKAPRSGGRLAALRTSHSNGTADDSSGSSTDNQNDTPMASNPRRESISTFTDSLQISTSNGNTTSNDSDNETPSATFKFQSPQVVRRPVTRRSNLLPKTKGFARIRAQLQEESSPVDSDMRRDAEVVRQVRVGSGSGSLIPNMSHQSTASSSPDLTPTIPLQPLDGSDMHDTEGLGMTLPSTEGNGNDITVTAAPDDPIRRSLSNRDIFAHLFASRAGSTPPPLPFSARHRSSSGFSSEDTRMDSPAATSAGGLSQTASKDAAIAGRSESESEQIPLLTQTSTLEGETPVFPAPQLPSAAGVTRKANAKRRRDDDFDLSSIKRRAVSPGMSVHSSPVLGQSPVSTGGGWWKKEREGSGGGSGPPAPSGSGGGGGGGNGAANSKDGVIETGSARDGMRAGSQSESREVRSASLGSTKEGNGSALAMAPPTTPSLGARRVGIQQGMTDTNDGLVRMSLE